MSLLEQLAGTFRSRRPHAHFSVTLEPLNRTELEFDEVGDAVEGGERHRRGHRRNAWVLGVKVEVRKVSLHEGLDVLLKPLEPPNSLKVI